MASRTILIEPKFQPMLGFGYDVELKAAHRTSDVKTIAGMVNAEHDKSGAVNAVTHGRVASWILSGNADSFIAIDHHENGKAAAHMAVVKWPDHCYEIRSIVVQPYYRGLGIYGGMSDSIIEAIFEKDPSATVVMIKNKQSQGYRLLSEKGFAEVPLGEVLKMGLELENPSGRYAYVLTRDAHEKTKEAGFALAAEQRHE